jgi:hypothetical protein
MAAACAPGGRPLLIHPVQCGTYISSRLQMSLTLCGPYLESFKSKAFTQKNLGGLEVWLKLVGSPLSKHKALKSNPGTSKQKQKQNQQNENTI